METPAQRTQRVSRRQAPRRGSREIGVDARREPTVRLLSSGDSRSVVELTSPVANNPLYRAFRALRALGVQIVHAEVRALGGCMIQKLHLLECDGSALGTSRLSEVLVALS